MPLQATSGAASYDAFGGGAAAVPTYIEDVFSCFLYTGTAASLTITNNIDLSTKGGLTWIKGRSGATGHRLTDTARGVTKSLASNSTAAEVTESTGLTAFGTTGFTIGADADYNTSAATYASWTFRKQPKFFDVVTYTGTGSARTVAHNLGSVPGCIIVKGTSGSGRNWAVWHRSLGSNNDYLWLESTAAKASSSAYWNNTAPTSTEFTVGGAGNTNEGSETYVAYLFAHDAGGFGLTGTDNVISCGSFVHTTASTQSINLGYEPQWVLLKRATGVADNWFLMDIMRGMTASNTVNLLNPNTSDAESDSSDYLIPTATGFDVRTGLGPNGYSYIYIAIRRGPMKVPTSGTSVFAPILATASTGTSRTVGFPADMTISRIPSLVNGNQIADRLRGYANTSTATPPTLATNSTAAESAVDNFVYNVWNTTALDGPYATTYSNLWLHFRRAPSFFDEVCYTCNNQASAITSNHNLNVIPEMMIVKKRAAAGDWSVYHKDLNGGVTPQNYRIRLNATNAAGAASGVWNNTAPTLTQFTVGTDSDVNSGTGGAVAYLFATCAGVSKVGSYTGTGTTKQIDCGFTAGARFVLIKRTDDTGDWYVWDTARGIVSGNDPYLLLNSTAAEVTSTDYIDTYSAGFEISSTAPAAINSSASGATYIFLAIA